MDNRKNNRYQNGFTLIEVLITMVILSVGIMAVATMQIHAVKGNSFARDCTEATTLAADRIERLSLAGYNDPLLADTDADGTNQDSNNDNTDDNGGGFGLNDDSAATADHSATQDDLYQLFWNVAIDEPALDTKTVRIIVRWEEGTIEKTSTFNFIKANI